MAAMSCLPSLALEAFVPLALSGTPLTQRPLQLPPTGHSDSCFGISGDIISTGLLTCVCGFSRENLVGHAQKQDVGIVGTLILFSMLLCFYVRSCVQPCLITPVLYVACTSADDWVCSILFQCCTKSLAV